jgi:hypothetical protein
MSSVLTVLPQALPETNQSRLARLAGGRVTRISVASMELVDALPLSAAGKVLERELRRPHWAAINRRPTDRRRRPLHRPDRTRSTLAGSAFLGPPASRVVTTR